MCQRSLLTSHYLAVLALQLYERVQHGRWTAEVSLRPLQVVCDTIQTQFRSPATCWHRVTRLRSQSAMHNLNARLLVIGSLSSRRRPESTKIHWPTYLSQRNENHQWYRLLLGFSSISFCCSYFWVRQTILANSLVTVWAHYNRDGHNWLSF